MPSYIEMGARAWMCFALLVNVYSFPQLLIPTDRTPLRRQQQQLDYQKDVSDGNAEQTVMMASSSRRPFSFLTTTSTARTRTLPQSPRRSWPFSTKTAGKEPFWFFPNPGTMALNSTIRIRSWPLSQTSFRKDSQKRSAGTALSSSSTLTTATCPPSTISVLQHNLFSFISATLHEQKTFCSTVGASILSAIETWWWSFPMILAVLPLYRWVLHSAPTVTPEWWKMTCMEYIRNSPDALAVVAVFLLSNISYFLASACFFALSTTTSSSTTTSAGPTRLTQASALLSALLLWQQRASSEHTTQELSTQQQQYAYLGGWIFACGLVSTIFHSLQALSTSLVAEAACFVDHGVALTCFLYFWRMCGLPRQKRFYITGGAGLLALSLPLRPGYAWLHSAWHVLSALAALFWGLQNKLPEEPTDDMSCS